MKGLQDVCRQLDAIERQSQESFRSMEELFTASIEENEQSVLKGGMWEPTYPEFSKLTEAVSKPILCSVGSKMSKSPLTVREMSENFSVQNLQSSLDGVPLDIVAARRPVVIPSVPVNKWKEATPPARLPPRFPPLQHSPPDTGATIPILPSTANVTWPPVRTNPHSPSANFQTPKPVVHPTVVPSCPGSVAVSFLPQYTPAGVAQLITEGLVALPTSPLAEDQYVLTDWEDSDAEKEKEESRSSYEKAIPAWCIGWVEVAKTQTSIDPDTVFGTRLPKCDLDVLFGKDNAYLRARRGKRGSSGEWSMDNVSRQELLEYRQVMGHTQQLESVVIVQQITNQV